VASSASRARFQTRIARVIAAAALALVFISAARLARADDPLAAGQRALEAGRPGEAEAAFREAVQREPEAALPHYYLGLALLEQDEPRPAARELERALQLDPALPGARSSLGIAWYESGRDDDAARELEQAVELDPRDATAHLFLGLALWRKGDRDAARTSLERAKDLETDPEAQAEMGRLLHALERGESLGKRWSIHASLATEYDDEVAQAEIDTTSGTSDFALVAEFGGTYALIDRGEWGLEVGYDFFQSLYADESDFDLQSHTLMADVTRELGDAAAGLGYRAAFATLDGDDFLDISALRPSLGWSLTPELYLEFALEAQDRDFDDSDRDADRLRYGLAAFVFPGNASRLRLAANWIEDDADGNEFDFDGYELAIGVRAPIAVTDRETHLEARFEYERRDYDEVTPSIGRERDDRQSLFALALEHALNRQVSARLEWERTDSDSNLSSVDYRQNIFRLQLSFEN
jgi:Flp pilus assembly protein TadD